MSGRLPGLGQRVPVTFTFDGAPIAAFAGDTIAMALWADGVAAVRNSSALGAPRGVFCNMGICYECLVVVGGATVRSCTTVVQDGMVVTRGGKP